MIMPTLELMRLLFTYRPDVAQFPLVRIRRKPDDPVHVGNRPGQGNARGAIATVGRTQYRIRDLVWVWFNGSIPELARVAYVGSKHDNTIQNLCLKSTLEQIGAPITYRGVWADGAGYSASFQIANKRFYVGYFATAQEAALAYDIAASEEQGLMAITNESLGLL